MATILQCATMLAQDSCALGKQLRKKLTSGTGQSPAPVLVLHSIHGLHWQAERENSLSGSACGAPE